MLENAEDENDDKTPQNERRGDGGGPWLVRKEKMTTYMSRSRVYICVQRVSAYFKQSLLSAGEEV